MNEACYRQVIFWSKFIKQTNKAIRKKNRYINRLQLENDKLRTEIAEKQLLLAEKDGIK